MKKIGSLILSMFLALNLLGCSGNRIGVATGGTSGTYYGFGSLVVQTLNEKCKDDLSLKVVSTGASKANIQLVDSKEVGFAIVQNDVMDYAYNGTDMFEGTEPITSFSAIASCYPEAIQIISTKNINSINELRGKRISVGDAGSGTEFNAKQILEIYGMDIDKDIIKSNQSFADSCEAIKNGFLDAAFVTAGSPTTAVTELSTTYEFNILSIDTTHSNSLKSKYKYYTNLTIPAGTYSCVPNDVNTVAVMATFIANNEISEDAVYAFTKGLFENKNEIAHAKAELLDPNTGKSGISIPLHKGAERYYTELGIK